MTFNNKLNHNKTDLLLNHPILISACTQRQTVHQPYNWPDVKAPVCEKQPKTLTAHGDSRTDNYYRLKDYFKKGPASVKVWPGML